jgi:hypothetical protein
MVLWGDLTGDSVEQECNTMSRFAVSTVAFCISRRKQGLHLKGFIISLMHVGAVTGPSTCNHFEFFEERHTFEVMPKLWNSTMEIRKYLLVK